MIKLALLTKETMTTPKKLSSYQKMKQRYEAKISELRNDVATLVENKDFMKVTIVKTKYYTAKELEATAWFGDSNIKK